MDAFYAAVEERYNPALAGRPVVVGADPKEGKGRGVVTTANYAAREFGIRSALPITRAWRLAEAAHKKGAPETVFLQPNFPLYRQVSTRIMKLLQHSADAFEEASIDEAYLDLSSLGAFDAAVAYVKELKTEIRETERLGCSVGVGPNKLIAKIASGYNKPDGLTVIRPQNVREFLDPLPIRLIPGIGPKTESFLHEQKIRTVKGLSSISEDQLTDWFGRWGQRLFEKSHGIDESPVSDEWIRKSIGQQETFEQDTLSLALVTERLYAMADHLLSKLREKQFAGFRTITLTVRFSDFDTKNRSRSLKPGIAIDRSDEQVQRLKQEALDLLVPFFDSRENPRGKAIRLIGLRLEKLF